MRKSSAGYIVAPDAFDILDLFESYRTPLALSSLLIASTLRPFHGCRTEQARAGARPLPSRSGHDRDRRGRGGRGADEHLRRRRPGRPRHVRPRRGVASGPARVGAGRPPRAGPRAAARRHEGGRPPARDRLRDAQPADVRRLHGAARGDRPGRAEAASLRPLRHDVGPHPARHRRERGARRRGGDRPGARGARRVVGQARALPRPPAHGRPRGEGTDRRPAPALVRARLRSLRVGVARGGRAGRGGQVRAREESARRSSSSSWRRAATSTARRRRSRGSCSSRAGSCAPG